MAVAQRLFYRDGYRLVGIDTLLAEAEVAKMTLYNHFASKEELIVAVIEKLDREVQAALFAAVESAGSDPTRRLAAVFGWLKEWFGSRDFRGCAFIRALSEYPDPGHPVHQAAWSHKQALNGLLRQLMTEAGAKNPAATANAISQLIDGAILAAHATKSVAPADVAKTAALTLLKQAVG